MEEVRESGNSENIFPLYICCTCSVKSPLTASNDLEIPFSLVFIALKSSHLFLPERYFENDILTQKCSLWLPYFHIS